MALSTTPQHLIDRVYARYLYAHIDDINCAQTSFIELEPDVYWRLCRRFDPPLTINILPAPLPSLDIIFDLVGQISREDCSFTVRGGPGRFLGGGSIDEGEVIMSCWLEARPCNASRLQFLRIQDSIQSLVDATASRQSGLDIDTSTFLAVAPQEVTRGSQIKIQVHFRARDIEAAKQLPIFDKRGNRAVPEMQAAVPFETAVRAMFFLDLFPVAGPTTGVKYLMNAPLVYFAHA